MYEDQGPMQQLSQCKPSREPPLVDRLKFRQQALQAELDDVTAALAALEANPTIADTLNKISRLGIR